WAAIAASAAPSAGGDDLGGAGGCGAGAAGEAARAALPPQGGPVSEPTVPALCLSCRERLPLRRGLCFRCYDRLGRAVRSGATTWAELEGRGQARAAQSRRERMARWFKQRP